MRTGDGHKTIIEVATYFNRIDIDKKVNVIIFCLPNLFIIYLCMYLGTINSRNHSTFLSSKL
jgi:hypothetical protein